MITALTGRRWLIAVAVAVAGAAMAWLLATPLGLLASVSALYLVAGDHSWRPLAAISLLGCLVALIVAHFGAPAAHELAISWAAFFGLAFCVGEVVAAAVRSVSPDAMQALRIIESMPARTWSASPDGRITHVSDSMLSYLGRERRQSGLFHILDNAGWRDAIHPDDYQRVMDTRRHSLITAIPFDEEYRLRGSDGTFRWFWSFGSLARDDQGEVAGWYGTMIDIEEKKRAEEALRDRERELSQLVDMVPVHIRRLTRDGNPTFFNKRLRDFYGLDVSSLNEGDSGRLSVAMKTLVHPDEADVLLEKVRQSIVTGEGYAMKYRLRRADGVYRWVDGRAEPLRDATGEIAQWYAISMDIDDEVRAEKALRESERSLRQLVETLPAMIDCAAPNGEPIYRSKQLREFLGYNLEDLDGVEKTKLAATLDAGVHPDDLDGVKARYAHSLATGEPYARRHRLRRHDGEYRWVETRAGPMRDIDGAIVQWNVICLDIDGEVKAEEELRLAQNRLARASQAASLAELSASIAHEVNQPLAAVVTNSHACERWLSADPPNIDRARKTVERIIRDANGAADVVGRIRALFKQSIETRGSTDLSGLVTEVHGLMAEELTRRRMRIDIDLDSELPQLMLDRIQIQQVFINLIRNGVDAMDRTTKDRFIRIRARRTDNTVRIEIHDRGRGLEFPDKMFHAFFTTKETGMGMGLAICRSIIESHGGRLWAEQAEPVGATFVFTLPVPETIAV